MYTRRKICSLGIYFIIPLLTLVISIPGILLAQERYQIPISFSEIEKYKKPLDDPRPFLKEGPCAYRNVLLPEVYRKLTFDVEKMKQAWAEVVGFKAPDVVGKIAPEIQPGTYSYKDKEKYPGLKELMIPGLYERFTPGGPPYGGNFPEIKIVPTRQYYFALPIAEATKKYEGETKLDSDGYLITNSYKAGYPFPKPSGPQKARQIVYNSEKGYRHFESIWNFSWTMGLSKNLRIDKNQLGIISQIRLQGRLHMEPFGWFDERAQKTGEKEAMVSLYMAPRDMFGNAFSIQSYADPDKFDYFLIYANVLRRIRTMSATDTQDAVGGSDIIFDDKDGIPKLTRNRYPYDIKVIGEREYLVPLMTLDGSTYLTSKGQELRNVEFERRPMYVVEMIQQDKNYVYSKRVVYMDKETFLIPYMENFDQKGRLYRTGHIVFAFIPEMGMSYYHYLLNRDHIDLHSTMGLFYELPAPWLGRDDVNIQALVKGK